MYFAKARKQLEEQDMREVQEKLEKYQRTDTARVVQQAKSSRIEDNSGPIRDDFRPDELPDGAFVSPKHTPSNSAQGSKPDHLTVSRSAEVSNKETVTVLIITICEKNCMSWNLILTCTTVLLVMMSQA